MCLRCTLNNLKINCQVNILSNKINKYKFFTTLIVNGNYHENNTFFAPLRTQKIHPWFITGFTDGEGCFLVSFYKDKRQKTGWGVQLFFQICLHKKDKPLLEKFKEFFTVGSITKHESKSVQYRISSIKHLQLIVDHFDKFSLITQKQADYELWKQVFYIVKNKEHFNSGRN